ncbi:MAG: tyrosine-type recombinase/integrase, partial [Coriobacteriia bacterium]|nr:tyrosine-type recombinase/integrase [Coriobacteriia bacterium]
EFLYACGARVSEASNLRLSWLELEEGFVRITGKGNKQRIVPLHSRSVDALDAYLRDGRRHLVRGQQCQDFVFLSSRGNQMGTTAIRRVFKRALALAGIDPSSTPHTVRHTFASDLLVGGADLRSVQELLGHASLSTTQVYTHLAPERLRDVHHRAHPRG